jgi:hypothetical protein
MHPISYIDGRARSAAMYILSAPRSRRELASLGDCTFGLKRASATCIGLHIGLFETCNNRRGANGKGPATKTSAQLTGVNSINQTNAIKGLLDGIRWLCRGRVLQLV